MTDQISGSPESPLIVARVVPVDDEGNLLLEYAGKSWVFPGSMLAPKEEYEDGMNRAIKGLDIVNIGDEEFVEQLKIRDRLHVIRIKLASIAGIKPSSEKRNAWREWTDYFGAYSYPLDGPSSKALEHFGSEIVRLGS